MVSFEDRLGAIAGHAEISRLQRGIERETLRITKRGLLSQEPHPTQLGAPLTHGQITTDFCEAQLELITGVHDSAESCLQELTDIHRYVAQSLEDEWLWPASMPCGLGPEQAIPIAKYGSSCTAQMKEVYRSGLSHRYGRVMQTISGIHYNFSIPQSIWDTLAEQEGSEANQAFRNEGYLRLTRNFRKHSWLLLLLFGASPLVCSSFLRGNEHNLQSLGSSTDYLPYATSLRLGPLGYQSANQAEVFIDHNSLEAFARTLLPTLTDSYSAYSEFGANEVDGYSQLNDSLLQIEAEYYGSIRIKRKTQDKERALLALLRRGIEYVEVRCVDIDPFDPIGISKETIRFLDVFLLHSLMGVDSQESEEQAKLNLRNQLAVVHEGLDPNLKLATAEGQVAIKEWAGRILSECSTIAESMDSLLERPIYVSEVKEQQSKVEASSNTPAAKLIELCQSTGRSFAEVGLELAQQHFEELTKTPIESPLREGFEAERKRSNLARQELEEQQQGSFKAFLEESLSMAEFA